MNLRRRHRTPSPGSSTRPLLERMDAASAAERQAAARLYDVLTEVREHLVALADGQTRGGPNDDG